MFSFIDGLGIRPFKLKFDLIVIRCIAFSLPSSCTEYFFKNGKLLYNYIVIPCDKIELLLVGINHEGNKHYCEDI